MELRTKLSTLPYDVGELGYDRSQVRPGIVHLGMGAFARGHLAYYVQRILRREPSWGIIGASLRKADVHAALKQQDFCYTLIEQDGAQTQVEVIGSLLDVIGPTPGAGELLAAMTNPAIKIVSLTVTEKGYCRNAATGALDQRHADIVNDLAQPEQPRSAVGLLVEALRLRRLHGTKPFTVISLDNLPENGVMTKRVAVGFAALRDLSLAKFIEKDVAFPSSMVDRIVPAVTANDRDMARKLTGWDDAWPIVTEPFCQWVLEDHFCNDRPDFVAAGVQMVRDVRPFEKMKLRMLNGSHSTMAYLGLLSGHEFVSEAVADPSIRSVITKLMTEEVPTTLAMSAEDLGTYRDLLLKRFANPALKHRLMQIAMDGSQKLPQRLLSTISERLKKGLQSPAATTAVAAWMVYLAKASDLQDPMSAQLLAVVSKAQGDMQSLQSGLLAYEEIFGTDLPRDQRFRQALRESMKQLGY